MFYRRKTELVSFWNGMHGRQEQREFFESLDKNGGRVIHGFTTYHSYSSSHIPETFNYVIEYKIPLIRLFNRSSQ